MTSGAKERGTVSVESGHQNVVHDVAMDFYGKRMASCSSDRSIKIFTVSKSSKEPPVLLNTLVGHQGPVWQVEWAHAKFGPVIASCSYDGKVIIWKEVAENEWTQWEVFEEHASSVNSISWAPYQFGLILACGSSDGTISVFTHKADRQWERTKIEEAHPVGVTSVSWAPTTAPTSLAGADSAAFPRRLVSGGFDNAAKVWKFADGNWVMDTTLPLSKHGDWVRDVAWAPNLGLPKYTIASASQEGIVTIWDQEKEGDEWVPKVLHDFKIPVWRVSWSVAANILAVADSDSEVTLWKEAVDGTWDKVDTSPM